MNILMVNQGQFGYMAGYYHYCKHLVAQGHHIVYLCNDYHLKPVELDGVDVIYTPIESAIKWRMQFRRQLKNIVTNNKFDVALCSYFKGCTMIRDCFKNIPTIIDIRSGDIAPNPIKRFLFNKLIQFETALYNRRMILSQSLADKLKLKRDSYDIVPLGADVICDTDKSYTDAINMLYVGTLKQRDIHKTIEGFVRFAKEHPQAQISYDIIGFGTSQEESLINNLISDNNIGDKVKFHGRINYQLLGPFFEKANLGIAFVPMTPYYDCQPTTKIYEYVLSGLYCIATRTYENRILVDERNTILCDDNADSFYQALKQFYLCDKSQWKTSEIKSSMSQYQWTNIVGNLLINNFKKLLLNNH